MRLTTEYLVVVEKNASEALYHLCDDTGRFNELLETDPDIVVADSSIRYREKLECAYEVKTGQVEEKEQRFFHVRLSFNGTEEEIGAFTDLLRSVRGIVHRSGGQPETLWDDVSLHYSTRAYPLIHKIENLMRKLIAYFMLTNVGKEWVAEASPAAVRDAIDRSKRKEYLDVLHQIDFIQLGDLLFKPYETRSLSDLFAMLDDAQGLDDLDLDELKAFESKSNWERYFADIVDCEDRYLAKRWNDLYDLRCRIAHNAIVRMADYQRIRELVDEVGVELQQAIDNIDKVHVPKAEKEQVAESVASGISAQYEGFIELWKSFEAALMRTQPGPDAEGKRTLTVYKRPLRVLEELHERELISDALLAEGRELVSFRNQLVHGSSVEFSDQEIESHIARLEDFIDALDRKWKDEVVEALKALGGQATLSEIYGHIEENTLRRLPDTWEATVRYTLALHSSDTGTYRGGDDLFAHLGRGRWGLRGS